MAEGMSERRSRVVSFIWLVAFVGAGAFFSVLLTQAVKERQRHEGKRVRVVQMHEQKTDEVEMLRMEREAGMTDPIYIEDVARNSMNYARPGEESYRRENIALRKVQAKEAGANLSPLAALVDTKLAKWQIPLSVLAVIVIALLIIRGFGPGEKESDVEGAQ